VTVKALVIQFVTCRAQVATYLRSSASCERCYHTVILTSFVAHAHSTPSTLLQFPPTTSRRRIEGLQSRHRLFVSILAKTRCSQGALYVLYSVQTILRPHGPAVDAQTPSTTTNSCEAIHSSSPVPRTPISHNTVFRRSPPERPFLPSRNERLGKGGMGKKRMWGEYQSYNKKGCRAGRQNSLRLELIAARLADGRAEPSRTAIISNARLGGRARG